MSRYEVNVAVTLWVEAPDGGSALDKARDNLDAALDTISTEYVPEYWFSVAEQAYFCPPEDRDDYEGSGADGWYTTNDLANAAGPDDGWSD